MASRAGVRVLAEIFMPQFRKNAEDIFTILQNDGAEEGGNNNGNGNGTI